MVRNIPVDSVSLLLFCIALVALTHEVNRADCGYQVRRAERKMSHLLHINGLKLIVGYEDELENDIQTAKAFGKHINMNFVLKKCAKI
jgi:hypothetical protein